MVAALDPDGSQMVCETASPLVEFRVRESPIGRNDGGSVRHGVGHELEELGEIEGHDQNLKRSLARGAALLWWRERVHVAALDGDAAVSTRT
jgi:hypothetical protein